jgi:pimeloyl-ACP methyl ester carboxylesterase
MLVMPSMLLSPMTAQKCAIAKLATTLTLLLLLPLEALATGNLPRLAMQVIGRGPVVVFESGSGEALGNWASVVPALAPCLTTVTYDRPGVGDSPPSRHPTAPVLAADVADSLLAQLRARDLAGPYILVGHSIGGLYVQAFARNHPRAVAGVVLVDASSPLEPPGVFVSKVPAKPGSVEAAEDAGVAPSVAALLAGPPFPPVPLRVIAATYHNDTPQHEALWRDVQRRTAALSPKGKLVVVDSGHFVQKEKPAAVISAVLAVAAESGANVAACGR